MKPAPGLVFEGHEPSGYTGDIIQSDDFGVGYTIDDFFRLPWVNHPLTVPELLFIRRSGHTGSGGKRWASHIAFPGGRHEPTDESALYTALRETWEEVGLDLADKDFVQVGRLDEREITTSLGKRLLMILSPFGESCHQIHKNLAYIQSSCRPRLSRLLQNYKQYVHKLHVS